MKTANVNTELVDIPGYNGKYYITREGKVFSAPNVHHNTPLEMTLQRGRSGREDGFLRIRIPLDNKWYRVHKLVAEVFIPRPENCNDVRHKDSNKDNNSVENLEWFHNPEIVYEIEKISFKAYGWSKYGGKNLGLVQEKKTEEWSCQACGMKQASELPSYMFEFSTNEFIRICSICQATKLMQHIKSLTDLLGKVRKPLTFWD